eukprot:TRINITY_DN36665_c0_g1_i1.p1 TRINITY_DN36665_c0_g1~~TRINITY_DN36665_c0_g1_i1.p1  ORF type:complete len:141 (-),score=27.42 TRINITY_DN36665_c0_g1_i1:396-764(-)
MGSLLIWKELWGGLLHKVFRAMRSIFNGIVLFLLACNRHRLSTYHYTQAKWTALQLRAAQLVWGPARVVAEGLQRKRVSADDMVTNLAEESEIQCNDDHHDGFVGTPILVRRKSNRNVCGEE